MATRSKAKATEKPKKDPAPIPAGCEALLGKAQICAALGISIRTFQAMMSAGEYPKADIRIGIFPRWRIATHNAWIEERARAGTLKR